MQNKLLEIVNNSQMHKSLPDFRVGDNIDVHVRIKEGKKERIQVFSGLVISKKGSGLSEMFTVYKISYGIGVERIFPLHSPTIAMIKIQRRNKIRRSKLYYMRERKGKSARLKEIKMVKK